MRKIAVGQAGGPTAVINASLVGLLDGLYETNTVYAVMNGYQGLVEDDMEPLEEHSLEWVQQHKLVPGACLGSGRYPFTNERMQQAVEQLKRRGIDTLVFIGGNGTMAALQRLSVLAEEMHYKLQVIGIPKTVDNDLSCTDHAPGFASAARYVAMTARDISKDLEAMRNFEQVRIIETMGRNAGWLALSSGYLKTCDCDGPHHIYVPERPLAASQFLSDVQSSVQAFGMATIVVSEGFTFEGTAQVEREVVQGRPVLGGIAAQMEAIVREQLGLTVRSENMGMHQRSAMYAVSEQDLHEAYEVGAKAAEYVTSGLSNRMVSIQRRDTIEYNYDLVPVPLEDVMREGERLLPDIFIEDPARYYTWLQPIVGEPVPAYPAMRRRSVRSS
ncbi:diphosphate--fructose-6-phosphate 1-phosphotransferase [Paenibacillus sp. YYML68]|uniref:diphosphate--fructose-6-phosphate 1-phosphotransferase n=1 Tax=Paenibacillus sp. YYML68 TaxID=2909250 RepID=UPI002490D36D|nr:diphosphate--fructose-6-phosphate 1-phosphotransferase [Paenibacillus sp. YYML68]